jgi:uncharacterized membrane protein YdjX (TVP38/TMEM64 family)
VTVSVELGRYGLRAISLLNRATVGCLGIVTKTRIGLVALLGLAALGAVGAFGWVYRDRLSDIDIQEMVDWIASFGPIPFFLAMAVLPSLWAPASPFLLLAGALYDLPIAIMGCGLALTVNQALSWLLAGKLFRPAFERLVHRFGYSVPEITPNSMISIAVLLRITPGVPFPLQNYLLGLARMPFGWYIAISAPISIIMGSSIIIFGDAIMKGNTALVLLAISLFIVISLGVRQLRSRLNRKAREEKSS